MNNKHLGNIAELALATKLVQNGYTVSFPFGDNAKYDLLVDSGTKINRVQVKATYKQHCGDRKCTWRISLAYGRNNKSKYKLEDVDVFAVYVGPINLWYFIPRDKIEKTKINLNKEYLDFKEDLKAFE